MLFKGTQTTNITQTLHEGRINNKNYIIRNVLNASTKYSRYKRMCLCDSHLRADPRFSIIGTHTQLSVHHYAPTNVLVHYPPLGR